MQTRTTEQNQKLIDAARRGDVAAINAALAAGAEVNARDEDLVTPLMHAAQAGKSEALVVLLAKGADASLVNRYKSHALFLAARMKQPEALVVLVDHLIEKYKATPDKLLAHLNVSTTPKMLHNFGTTYEIAAPILKLIDFLRNNKISSKELDVFIPENFVMPAKSRNSITKKNPAPVQAKPAKKKSNPAETEKLVDAASKNDLAGVIAALNAGAEIDASTAKHGGNALHVASMNNFTNIMAELIKHGADVNCRSELATNSNVNGATPLIWAAQKPRNSAAIELLLTNKANVNLTRNDGVTVFNFAIERNPDACQLLLKHGADVTLTYLFLLKNNHFKKLIANAEDRKKSLLLMKSIDFLLATHVSHGEINALLPEKYTFKNQQFKEDILAHMSSLPAPERLALCHQILTDPTHPYRVILGMQRGWRACKLGHGILKQVADMQAATANIIINTPVEVKVVTEVKKPVTVAAVKEAVKSPIVAPAPAAPVAEATPVTTPPTKIYPTLDSGVQQNTPIAVVTPVAVAKPVAVVAAATLPEPLQPSVLQTFSIFIPGKAIELVFDTPNPEIDVPVLQPVNSSNLNPTAHVDEVPNKSTIKTMVLN